MPGGAGGGGPKPFPPSFGMGGGIVGEVQHAPVTSERSEGLNPCPAAWKALGMEDHAHTAAVRQVHYHQPFARTRARQG